MPRIPRTPPHRHTLKLLVAPVIFLVICSNIAAVTWPTLSQDHPLLLIALSSINRYLLLVSDQLDPVSYYVVGTLRLLLSDPLFFLLGYWYGDRALAWMDERSGNYGPMLRRAERAFGKYGWPLVAIMPNNYICLFAGAAGMRVGVFFVVNLAGTVTRLYLLRVASDVLEPAIDWFEEYVARYTLWFILGSAVIVAISMRGEFGKGGELDQLAHIDEELGSAENPSPTPHEDHE